MSTRLTTIAMLLLVGNLAATSPASGESTVESRLDRLEERLGTWNSGLLFQYDRGVQRLEETLRKDEYLNLGRFVRNQVLVPWRQVEVFFVLNLASNPPSTLSPAQRSRLAENTLLVRRATLSLRRVRRAYYALVTYIDIKVGQLLDSLQENGLRQDTIVIFTSDHGDMLGEKGMVQKRTFYEWSSRVPLLLRFPDGWQRGAVRAEPISLVDLLPTCLDMVGVQDWLPVDGRSLLDLLDGRDMQERVVFSEYHSLGAYAPCFMVRQGQWKYVHIHGYDAQLFDLQADPGEWHNLAGQPEYQATEAHLKACLLQQFDPNAIEQAVRASVQRRLVLKRAMERTRTRWDYEPRFDPTKGITDQYLPGEGTASIPR